MTEPRLAFEKAAYFHTELKDGRAETSIVAKAELENMDVYVVGSMHPSSEQAANGLLTIQANEEGQELSELHLLPHNKMPDRPKRTLAVLAQAAFSPLVVSGEGRTMISATPENDMQRELLAETLGMGRHVPEGKHTRGRVRAFAQEVLRYSAKSMFETGTSSAPVPGDYGIPQQKAG